jgi:hypothetical protein
VASEYPKEQLVKNKTVFDWETYPDNFKNKWYGYIDDEFTKEMKGIGFIIKFLLILLALITCTCSGPRLMLGSQTLGKQTDYSSYSGKLAKPIDRCYGMCYLKNRRSGFSFMASGERLIWQQYLLMLDSEYLSKQELMLKRCLQTRWYQYQSTIRSFSSQYRTEWTDQRRNSHIVSPPQNYPKVHRSNQRDQRRIEGLDTTIDWKNTGDNSYDGEKLRLLVHDESGKWERPDNILNNWRVTKTTLRLGSKIIGKCMMGSTSNALDKGGDNFKKLYDESDVTKRNRNGQTSSGLYSLFIPMEWNYEGFIDTYGLPVFDTPEEPIKGVDGQWIDIWCYRALGK